MRSRHARSLPIGSKFKHTMTRLTTPPMVTGFACKRKGRCAAVPHPLSSLTPQIKMLATLMWKVKSYSTLGPSPFRVQLSAKEEKGQCKNSS
eukprot:6087647-Amphidinium_carterae.2